jgi:cell wall-associated NlpC family hydrolase
LGALTTVVVGSLLLALGVTLPAVADDYPSWADVQNARQNQAATEAEISKIEGLLVTLESDADALGKVAQQKGEAYNAAKEALDAASAKSVTLQQQVQAADARAEMSSRRAGQLVAQLARTGGGSLTLGLVFSPSAGDLLNSLGTMSKLTEQSTLIYRQAITDKNLAQSLADQAKLAEKKRKALATSAQEALDAAKASADAALAQVAEQKTAADQMYAQLASLKGTTTDVEAGYAAGLTAAQEQAAQPPPPPPSDNPPNAPPPPPNESAVATALNFAYAQLGDMYEFAGSGPDTWDCSGLTKAAYAAAGVYIGAHLVSSQYYTMANQGRLVPLSEMVPGDLIFYADGGYPGDFYHVAMYVGNGQMIEAPREGVPVRVTGVRYYDALAYAGRPTP